MKGWFDMALKKNIGKTLIKGAVALATVNVAVCAVISQKKKKAENSEQLNEKNLCKHFEVFMHGRQIDLGDDEFNKVKIKTFMGGVNLDLRNASISEDIKIKCKSFMGGINIRVPEGVNVVIQGTSLFGGVTNFVPTLEGEGIPTIYIEAVQVIGGLCVKSGLPYENVQEDEDCEMDDEACHEDVNADSVEAEEVKAEAVVDDAQAEAVHIDEVHVDEVHIDEVHVDDAQIEEINVEDANV